MLMQSTFEYVLPVIRGIQAGREYYISMCPLRVLPKLFPLDEEEISPMLRASRSLNKQRVREIGRYILNNPKSYIFSAMTVSIDAEIQFEPVGNEAELRKLGRLRVPMDARFIINDGKHRRAAFELALKENPELGYETVAVVFFLDIGLQRCQQMFADLNRFAVVPETSLNMLYDTRDSMAKIVREVVREVRVFRELTELEKDRVPVRSGKLFTLRGIYGGTMSLLVNFQGVDVGRRVDLAVNFWQAVCGLIPDWELVLQRKISAFEVRRDFVHCHGVGLTALGEVGSVLLGRFPDSWEGCLSGLSAVDWSVSNPLLQGVVVGRGGVSSSRQSLGFLRGYIGRCLGVV